MTPSMVRSMATTYRDAFKDEAHAIELEALARTLDRLYAERDELERAKGLLARAHGLLEGQSQRLVHEIADFLGWAREHVVSELPSDADREKS
jgi:hypothetical protein